jgi:hypothetical protein
MLFTMMPRFSTVLVEKDLGVAGYLGSQLGYFPLV